LLTAFTILLSRMAGQEDVIVGSSFISFNPLVLRCHIKLQESFQTILSQIVQEEESAAKNEIPFTELLKELLFADSLDAPPLFRVRFFNLTDTSPETLKSSQTSVASSTELTIFISQSPSTRQLLPIQMKLVYNSLLFSHQRILNLLDALELLIQSASLQPQVPVGQLSLVAPKALQILPDPQADLHWDGFEGSITDLFAKNAKLFPTRTCVVESIFNEASQKSLTRTFNYEQIHQASNILAHYLLRKGIQREDVVVLYSYRGVDLVVAVMGVLKAGATFSVIDPAYPPSRQIVYLSVAQPKGLVVLRKAGVLHDDVRHYISKELTIQVEVPSLLLNSDGSVEGDLKNEIFLSDLDKKTLLPDVVLGPDSIGTLSFTSGSTGIPKGVRGRHYSLTHFYPWMKQEFEMTEKEKFTMLSGIAHDPIQRDSTCFFSF
jgi:L-aminoadipate-semialdehyde dehydrogenase